MPWLAHFASWTLLWPCGMTGPPVGSSWWLGCNAPTRAENVHCFIAGKANAPTSCWVERPIKRHQPERASPQANSRFTWFPPRLCALIVRYSHALPPRVLERHPFTRRLADLHQPQTQLSLRQHEQHKLGTPYGIEQLTAAHPSFVKKWPKRTPSHPFKLVFPRYLVRFFEFFVAVRI